MSNFRFPRWLDGVWCALLAIYAMMGVALVPLHGDEPTQIYMGRDFYYQFVTGQSDQVQFRAWDSLDGEDIAQQELRLLNGTLPKYLFGLAGVINGYALDEINQQWAWGSGWDWNHENGHVPPDDLLFTARYFSTAMLAGSAIALFWLGYATGGRFVAYVASAVYILNPAVLVNGRRAMMEGGLLLFSVLVVLIGLWALRKRTLWAYALLGIVSGLAVASKHTAVVTVLAVFVVIGGDALLRILRERKTADFMDEMGKLIGAGVLSLMIFFALNPAWWSDPIGRVGDVLRLRSDLLAGQVGFFGGYESPVEQVTGFGRQAFVVPPIYADSDFDGFISQQADLIAAYDSSLWAGVSPDALGGILLAGLALAGIAALRWHPPLAREAAWLVGVWFAAMIALTLILTPLEWQRYYLPLYPVLALMIALGADWLLTITGKRTGAQS